MATSMDSDLSPVAALTAVLKKLTTGEFASQKLPHRCTIRRQIETLMQSDEDFRSLSKALDDEISALISSLSARKTKKSFVQAALWPK